MRINFEGPGLVGALTLRLFFRFEATDDRLPEEGGLREGLELVRAGCIINQRRFSIIVKNQANLICMNRNRLTGPVAFALFIPFLFSTFSLASGADIVPSSTCKVRYPSDGLMEWDCLRIGEKETLEALFKEGWKDIARFNRMDRRHAYTGVRVKAPKDLSRIKNFTPMPFYYPPAEPYQKFLLVDLSEQFLGAYESGALVFSAPANSGEEGNETPQGEFRIIGFHRNHRSSKYLIEKSSTPYPMNYALEFHIDRSGISYWIHGRDMPGYPASHGCIGLYNEEMQKKYYGYPADPVLEDARTLYEWAIGSEKDDGRFHTLKDGPKVVIIKNP